MRVDVRVFKRTIFIVYVIDIGRIFKREFAEHQLINVHMLRNRLAVF